MSGNEGIMQMLGKIDKKIDAIQASKSEVIKVVGKHSQEIAMLKKKNEKRELRKETAVIKKNVHNIESRRFKNIIIHVINDTKEINPRYQANCWKLC